MQRESSFKYSINGTTSSHKEPLKVLLKLIFDKYKGRNSQAENSPKIRMSDLKDDLLVTTLNTSKEKLTEDETIFETTEPQVINLDLNETVQQLRGRNRKRRVKTIKINITISEDDDVQQEQIRKKEPVDDTPSEKKNNRRICVMEQFDNDSPSLVLKSPEKVEYGTINIPNNKIDCQSREVEFHEQTNTQEDVLKNKPWIKHQIGSIPQQGTKNIMSFSTIQLKTIDFLKTEREQCCLVDNKTLISRNNSVYSKKNESMDNFLVSEKLNNEKIKSSKVEIIAMLPKINNLINVQENSKQIYDITKNNKEKRCIKEISAKFLEAEKQFNKPSDAKENHTNKLDDSSFNLDKTRDSLIIHEIILEHYSDVLNYFTKKISNRHIYKKSIPSIEKEESLQHVLNNYFHKHDEETRLNGKSLDSGLHDMNLSKSMDTIENNTSLSEEKVEYNSREFLMEALGPDLMSIKSMSQSKLDINSTSASPTTDYTSAYGIEKSIGSSEISTLVSNTDCKSGIYSLYSTVKKTKKKKSSTRNPIVRPLFPSVSTNSYDYESIDKFRIYSRADELNTEISALQEVITQVSNAINLCNCKPKLYGTTSHLEAERILLLAKYKMEILNNELNKYEYEEIEQEQSCGTVRIKTLKFSRTVDASVYKTKYEEQYYLCLINSGTTVLASDIISAEENGDIIFDKPVEFNFDNLSDVELKFRVYSINITNNRIKENSCFASNKLYSPRNKKANNSTHSNTSQLLANARIGITELSCENKFNLNSTLEAISETFDADILIRLKLNNQLSGFLTISTGHAFWNRKWCALDGLLLKYWNCPSEENDAKPTGTIDLRNCMTYNVSSVDKSVCARARTFVLDIKSDTATSKVYFLSADNLSEFTKWKRQINAALMVLRNLNKLKCQTEILN